MKLHTAALLFMMLAQNGVIRVNTRLVQVNVVVRDKNGPVSDLKKEDFIVLDNGKPQRIDVFSVMKDGAVPRQTAAAARSGIVSNLLNSSGEVPAAATVILFDLINLTNDAQENLSSINNARVGNANFGNTTFDAMEDQKEAIKQLLGYLRSIRKQDRVALYVLGNELSVIQDFTGDPDRLVRAAERLRQKDAAGVEVRNVEELVTLLSDPDGYIGTEFPNAMIVANAINRATATADALQSIARHLTGLPGRKSLVWMSAGFPFVPPTTARSIGDVRGRSAIETPDNFSSQLNRASKALNDAGVSLYPVDVQRLRGGYPEVMLRLADATGGRVAQHTNDLEEAVRTAVADGEVSYTLGFYPMSERFDGKLHDLKVKVDRKGVDLHHRSGYYAVDPTLTPSQRQAVMAELINSPLNASQVGLVATTESDKTKPGTFRVAISIDLTSIQLEQQNDKRTGTLSVASRLASSKSKNAKLATIPISLSEEQYRFMLPRGLVIQQTTESGGPHDRLRIVVQDQATGLAGAITLPLESEGATQ